MNTYAENLKQQRIARATKMKRMLKTMSLADIGRAQEPPISRQRVHDLIKSLAKPG